VVTAGHRPNSGQLPARTSFATGADQQIAGDDRGTDCPSRQGGLHLPYHGAVSWIDRRYAVGLARED